MTTNILQEARTMGLTYRVINDGEIAAQLQNLPDCTAHLSEFNGQVWCEVSEAYAGTTVKSGVLPTVVQVINFAQFHSFLFENELLRSMADHCEWHR